MPVNYIDPIRKKLPEERPQVLLFGNGFFYKDMNWMDLLKKCKSDSITEDIFQSLRKADFLLLADAIMQDVDSKRQNSYIAALNNSSNKISKQELLTELLNLKFDVIVTTNYTYQIERTLDSDFRKDTKGNTIYHIGCKDSIRKDKRLLHTFQRVEGSEGSRDIWHMHGEQRVKSSIILSHDEYGRLISDIVQYNSNRRYTCDREGYYYFESWFDYLLYGDIYVLGFGANFSEFDFWWILERRMREKDKTAIGKFVFYEPLTENNELKKSLLHCMGCEYRNLGYVFTNKTKDYDGFYRSAIADMERELITRKE